MKRIYFNDSDLVIYAPNWVSDLRKKPNSTKNTQLARILDGSLSETADTVKDQNDEDVEIIEVEPIEVLNQGVDNAGVPWLETEDDIEDKLDDFDIFVCVPAYLHITFNTDFVVKNDGTDTVEFDIAFREGSDPASTLIDTDDDFQVVMTELDYESVYDIFTLTGISGGEKKGIEYTTTGNPKRIHISETDLKEIVVDGTEMKVILVGNESITVYREL